MSRSEPAPSGAGERGGFRMRAYRVTDRDAVYEVCLKTGDSGNDATALYRDPLALGNLYVGPYVDMEPDLAFVLEDGAGVCGYVLGALDTRKFEEAFVSAWLPPLQAVTPDPQGDPSTWSPDERIYHQIHHPRLDHPAAIEPYPSHLHIDLLPRAQGLGWGRRMLERLLHALRERGSHGVHLGVGAANTRAQGFYRRLGFDELLRVGNEDRGAIYMGRPL